jgi:hypothetical protein
MEDCPSIYGMFLSLVFQGPFRMFLPLRRNPNDQSVIPGLQDKVTIKWGRPLFTVSPPEGVVKGEHESVCLRKEVIGGPETRMLMLAMHAFGYCRYRLRVSTVITSPCTISL